MVSDALTEIVKDLETTNEFFWFLHADGMVTASDTSVPKFVLIQNRANQTFMTGIEQFGENMTKEGYRLHLTTPEAFEGLIKRITTVPEV